MKPCVACGARGVAEIWDYPVCGTCLAAWEVVPSPAWEEPLPSRLEQPAEFNAYVERSNLALKRHTHAFLSARRAELKAVKIHPLSPKAVAP